MRPSRFSSHPRHVPTLHTTLGNERQWKQRWNSQGKILLGWKAKCKWSRRYSKLPPLFSQEGSLGVRGGQKRIWISSCHLWIQKNCYFWGDVHSNFFNILKKCFLVLFFFFGPAACGILVPQPGVEVLPPEVGAQDLNHWITRKVLKCPFSTQYLSLSPPSHSACSTPSPISLLTQWARIKQVT